MAVNRKLLQGAAGAAGGLVPSQHFGVVTYYGDGSSSNKVGDGSFTVLGLPDTGTAFPYLVSEKVYSSGKYYFEINDLANGNTGNMQCLVGIVPTSFRNDMTYPWKVGEQGLFWYQSNGQLYVNGSGSGSYGTFAAGDDVAVAVDFDNNTMTLYKNGSQTGTTITGVPSGTYYMSVSTGYYQYKGKAALKETLMQYSIPSGYKAWGGDIDTSGDWSNYSEYDGTLDFQPDLVWIKDRSVTRDHNLTDSTRGVTHPVYITTGAELTNSTFVTSFDTGGFTLGNNATANENGEDFVAWCWKANGGTTSSNTDGTVTSTVQANTAAGFSIIKYTGNGVINQSIGHGLNSTPELYITKNLDTAGTGWFIKTTVVDGSLDELALNTTDTASNIGNTNLPTSSVIYQYNNTNLGANGQNYIVYAFHSVENFSKIGSYVGNGSYDGPIVETGFEPAFLMIKQTNDISNWVIVDNKRSTTNPRDKGLRPNTNDTESTVSNNLVVDFLSNGFQLKQTSGSNANNGNFIYMAFAADPDTEAPAVAKSFSTVTYTGNGTSLYLDTGFKPGLIWTKPRSYADNHQLWDIVRGPGWTVYSNSAIAENPTIRLDGVSSFDDNGFSIGNWNNINVNGSTYVAWAWKADDNEPTILPNTELSSLISKYKFESNANDDYGDNNGTASNLSYVSGRFGKAADFNGSSSKILYPQAAPFNDSNTILAISAWVKLDSASDEFVIMSASSTSDQNDVTDLIVGGSNIRGRIFIRDASGSDELQASFGSTNDTNWNHYVWQLSATNGIELWVNGVSQTRTVTVQTGGMTTNSWFSDIAYATGVQYATGINRVVTTQYYAGEVDQMRLFNAELTSSEISDLYNEGIEALVSANANAGFSIVKYEGTGVAGTKVPHGLSAAPELIIIKNLDTAGTAWVIYNSTLGATKYLHFSSDAEQTTSLFFNDTNPSSTAFTLGTHIAVNGSGNEFIAYCFHSVSGYSKIGSYSGTGSSQTITTGFQPDWIVTKRTDTTDNWRMYDSVRQNAQPFDEILYPNLNNAEEDNDTFVTGTTSTGFTLGTGGGSNASGGTYIYMAFKIN